MVMLPDEVRDRVTSYIKHQGTKSREALVDLVQTSQKRYLEAISGLDEAMTRKKPAADEWSLRELTLHVMESQTYVASLVERTSRGETPAARNAGLGMTRDDDGRTFAALVDELSSLNTTMLDTIRNLPENPDRAVAPPHPFFGPLNCTEWAVFQRVHDEDHVQHAGKIISAVGGAAGSGAS